MKHILFILALSFSLLMNGCKKSSQNGISEFQSVKTIEFQAHNISGIIGLPSDMVILGDLILVLDIQGNWFFHVYSLQNYNFLGNGIRRGRGPNEETNIMLYIRPYGGDAILYNNENSVKIARVGHQGDTLEFDIVEQYKLPRALHDNGDFFKINDTIYSSFHSYMNNPRDFWGTTIDSDKVFEWGELLPLSQKATNNQPSPLNQKLTTVKPTEDLIATVYMSLPILRIYGAASGNLKAQLYMEDASENEQILLDPNPSLTKDLVSYYYRIKSTNEYIYALYAGWPVSAHFKEGEMSGLIDFSNEIHVWDWDGTPVMKLKLNRPIFSFDITADNKHIIASSIVDVEELFEAEIPWD